MVRAAVCKLVYQLKYFEASGHNQHNVNCNGFFQHWNGNMPQRLPSACAVNPGGFEDVFWNRF